MSVEGGVGSGGGGAAVKIKAACFAAPQSGLTRTEDGRRSRVIQDMTRSRTHARPSNPSAALCCGCRVCCCASLLMLKKKDTNGQSDFFLFLVQPVNKATRSSFDGSARSSPISIFATIIY